MRPTAEPTSAGQESVWSFPRPAIAERTAAQIVIEDRGRRIADSRRTVRALETSHPPSIGKLHLRMEGRGGLLGRPRRAYRNFLSEARAPILPEIFRLC
ncbi:hypothetical protein SAMN06297251_12810 [Fulvimarina manganoxydans]|uniref:Uncharacterized protein n=1 Tax=Fulvimarina manganoxydans TaxID=937218 RepID=A0A1W2ENG9_9HYPH|nr:hypothetical protein SAMN06297251_12810 [Fulvimarina manganoxydans]